MQGFFLAENGFESLQLLGDIFVKWLYVAIFILLWTRIERYVMIYRLASC